MSEKIYIKLLNENIETYRPVDAESVRGAYYRILPSGNYGYLTERWEFPPGSIVFCKRQMLDGGEFPVAISLTAEARKRIQDIKDILSTDWDPIGVGEFSKDEYDSYAYEIYSMFLKGDLSTGKITDYLLMVVKDYMGFIPREEKEGAVANKISLVLGLNQDANKKL